MSNTSTMISRSFKLPPSVDRLLDDTAKKMGMNKTATLILAINELADKKGIAMRSDEDGADRKEVAA